MAKAKATSRGAAEVPALPAAVAAMIEEYEGLRAACKLGCPRAKVLANLLSLHIKGMDPPVVEKRGVRYTAGRDGLKRCNYHANILKLENEKPRPETLADRGIRPRKMLAGFHAPSDEQLFSDFVGAGGTAMTGLWKD